MRRNYSIFVAAIVTLFLAGCGGNGSSAPAPNNVNVVAGDTTATITWDMLPGVEYWVFNAPITPGSSVTPQNCGSLSVLCKTAMGVSSPAVISGLTNGTLYSFSINGRRGGPGGPGSTAVQTTPTLAGAKWSLGSPLSSNDIHGVVYGSVLVAAGANGTLLSSLDGITWKALTNPVSGANFNAVTYYNGQYLVVGTGGVILRSTDAVTWIQQTSHTTYDLYAVSNWGIAGFVATGVNGTILTSSDGVTWTPRTSPTTNTLFGITYGYNKYVAVGGADTLLTSTDGVNWVIAYSPTSPSDLKGVAYGLPLIAYGYVSVNPTIGTFVAVGANGALVTSTDGGASWTTQTPIQTSLINAVSFGHQFIAVDNVGGIFTSTNGTAWQQATSPVTMPLYAISPALFSNASGLYIGQYAGLVGQNAYLAAGAAGNGMLSF